MYNESTFKFFLTYTLSNKYFHCFLILLEYIAFIFPSCYQAALKLHHYGLSTEAFFTSTPKVSYLLLIVPLHTVKSLIIPILVFSFILLIIICYYLILIFGISKSKLLFVPYVITINFIDLNLFRYLSLYPLDYMIWLFINFYLVGTALSNGISLLFFVLFFIFILTSYYYIDFNAVIINISNPLLVDRERSYPYDHLSSDYQKVMLLLKALIAIEFNYFLSSSSINSLIIFFNVLIIASSLYLFYLFTLKNVFLDFNYSLFYVNMENNYLRNAISTFNTFICLVTLILYNENCFVVLLIALNFTLLSLYLQHKFLFNYALVDRDISYELLLLMILPDSKKNSFFFQYSHMLDATYIKHTNNCKGGNCNLCNNYSKDFLKNIHLFYKYLKKETKSSDSIYEKIVKLLYYKMTNQSIKMFRFYYGLVYIYKGKKPSLVRTLRTIVENWLIKENAEHEVLIDSILEVKKLENSLADFLLQYGDFINDNFKMQRPEWVVKLSDDIAYIINHCRGLSSRNILMNDQSLSLEANNKSIAGAITYTMHILRFIIETLINQEMIDLPMMNLDNLDEYLKLHFDNDRLLICSLDLRLAHHQQVVQVIKVTGELTKNSSDVKYISDYFPREVRHFGIEQFFKQIKSKKSTEKKLLFPFQIKGLLCFIQYTFFVIPTIQKKCIMFFGNYTKKKTKYILVHVTTYQGINIIAFCKNFLNLIQFKKRWIQYLRNINCYLSFGMLFKKITEMNQESLFECELDYEIFMKRLEPILAELRSLESFTSLPKNKVQLDDAIETLKSYLGYSLIIHLEKQVEYFKGYSLYSVKVKKKFTTSIFPTEKGAQLVVEQKENLLDNYIANTLQSSTCSGEMSVFSSHLTTNSRTSQYQMLSSNLKSQISKSIRLLSFFSVIMIIFNVTLICLSLIFLYTQITNSKSLTVLNELYFKFKSIQISFSNIIIIIIASACFADSPEALTCTNFYSQYSDYFLKEYGLSDDYSIIKYLSYEIKVQGVYSLTVLNDFKSYLFSSQNTKFIAFLEETIDFYQIQEGGGTLASLTVTVKTKETFENCMRKYINSILLLSNSDFLFESIPLYLVEYFGSEYHFHYLPSPLTPIQKELYIALLNYINFFYSFQAGEEEIKAEFIFQDGANYQMNLSFVILMACLNFCLCTFCIINMRLAFRLFIVLISNVVHQIDKGDNIAKLNKKVSVLSSLVKLYHKNPNDLIKKVKVSQTPFYFQEKLWKKNAGITSHTPSIPLLPLGIEFFITLLGRLSNLVLLLFGLYYIVVIIFNIVIFSHYNQLSQVFGYISLQFSFENGVFSNLAFTGLVHVTNMSNDDLALLIGRNNTEDGILNTLIVENLDQMRKIFEYNRMNSSSFPSLANSYNYSCDEIFVGFEDSFLLQVSNLTQVDYAKLLEAACDAFNPLQLKNFFFMRSDIIDRTHRLISSVSSNDYQSMQSFFKHNDLYEAYTIIIFLFRPLTFNFRWNKLIPMIANNFTTYVVLIGVYLVVNIILELIIFVVVKWVVIKKLHLIQENLFLFNNCIK